MSSGSGREERESLRRTFDTAADRYHDARPDYPPDLFDELVRLARLEPGARLLEIGAGTGKATVPMARRGFQIVCLELGTSLAEVAVRNLSGFPDVEVIAASFDDWEPRNRPPFDLVFAATAWHWLDPKTRYARAWEALRPGGRVAFWSASHVFPDGGDPFFHDIQAVYEEIGEGVPPDATWPRPGELPDQRDEIEATGLFTDVQVRHYDWEVRYDAESYVALLRTFSGHLAMAEWKERRLYDAVRTRLAAREDGVLRRHWGAALHVATRTDLGEPVTFAESPSRRSMA
ncbi:MAG: methyltransferase domain-containing protein [Propionibacteriales bacterium]|nr:methyltransferase domain-containing protein [Propionibacteriales bacterium]